MHPFRVRCWRVRCGSRLSGCGSGVQAAQKRPSVADLLAHPWIAAHTPRRQALLQHSVQSMPSVPAPETPSKEDTRSVGRAQVGFAAQHQHHTPVLAVAHCNVYIIHPK